MISVVPLLKKRIKICGVNIDSRKAFVEMSNFIDTYNIKPYIDRRFSFAQLPQALACMAEGKHVGKIVVMQHA